MTTIDWSDPEFCKKYQYRNGHAIVDVQSLSPSMAKLTLYHHYTTDGIAVRSHMQDGRFLEYGKHPCDIVPIPREPRRGEGWMTEHECEAVWLNLYVHKPHVMFKPFRVKWEEVIE